MQCALTSYQHRCPFAAATAAAAASVMPVSVVCVVDRVYARHIEVTRAASNWARIAIRAPPEEVHAYVGDALRCAMAMLRAVGPCGSISLSLDAVHVGGPDYVGDLTSVICATWKSIAGDTAVSPAAPAAGDAASDTAASATAAATARVRERAAGGGAPNFARTTPRALTAARNYVTTTHGNSQLGDAVITEVCENLRASSLARLPAP